MSTDMISFKNVHKSYPDYYHVTGGIKHFLFNLPESLVTLTRKGPRYKALSDLTFNVKKGETFGIIGRNGAGKSTLLGIIAGVLTPDSGTVQVNGRVSPMLELGAGFAHDLTGRENIMLNGILMGLTKREILAKLDEIIDFADLDEFMTKPIRTYSSGMIAKLGFSVVAHLNPEIILLDEVLAVGDIVFAEKCTKKMHDFWSNPDVTTVFVSHSMDQVKKICHRAMWVEDHKIKMIGKANEVADAYLAQWQTPEENK